MTEEDIESLVIDLASPDQERQRTAAAKLAAQAEFVSPAQARRLIPVLAGVLRHGSLGLWLDASRAAWHLARCGIPLGECLDPLRSLERDPPGRELDVHLELQFNATAALTHARLQKSSHAFIVGNTMDVSRNVTSAVLTAAWERAQREGKIYGPLLPRLVQLASAQDGEPRELAARTLIAFGSAGPRQRKQLLQALSAAPASTATMVAEAIDAARAAAAGRPRSS